MARLGDIFVKQSLITQAQLDSALAAQGAERGMLGQILLRRGLITLPQLGEALAEQYGVPYLDLVPQAVNPQVTRLLPEHLARGRSCVPVAVDGRDLQLAMVAPDDIETISEAELITGYHINPVVALEGPVQAVIDRGFDDRLVARQTIVDMKMADLEAAEDADDEDLVAQVTTVEEQAPVVRLVRAILMGAINANCSDIHLEPHSPEMRVRYRVDGELQPVMTIPNHTEEAVVARIKVMADMDTTENRRPQDGRLSLVEGGTAVNFRVSTIPTVGGEKVVMRLLDEGNQIFELESLGLCDRDLKAIQGLIDKPYGMIVVTGPTGSGKSTTMYSVLSRLNSVSRNIVTVEDPVEYRLPGINQVASRQRARPRLRERVEVHHAAGPRRDHGRRDPRPRDRRRPAVQAALTGHLLISTLHTNDSVGAVAEAERPGDRQLQDRRRVARLDRAAVAPLDLLWSARNRPSRTSQLLDQADGRQTGRRQPTRCSTRGAAARSASAAGYSGRIPIYEIMTVMTPTSWPTRSRRVCRFRKLRELAESRGPR